MNAKNGKIAVSDSFARKSVDFHRNENSLLTDRQVVKNTEYSEFDHGQNARSVLMTPEVAYSYDGTQGTHSEAITGSDVVTPIVE